MSNPRPANCKIYVKKCADDLLHGGRAVGGNTPGFAVTAAAGKQGERHHSGHNGGK